MAPEPKTALNIVFGAMTFGREGVEQARVHNLGDCGAILDAFQALGHTEIDTARTYGGGSSEEYLGQLDWARRGLVMDTKLWPGKQPVEGGKTYSHRPTELGAALKTDKVDMWYLHAPDRSVPYEETLGEVNRLYQEGYFKRFGISNYAAWEICIAKNWKRPDVYQGVYNGLHRAVEPELFPCLRHYGIAFYAFNPLAGGLLTDRYQRGTVVGEGENTKGSRFDPERGQGSLHRVRYWNDAYFDALDLVKTAARKAGLSTAEAALRWISHHSELKRELGDAVLVGASSLKQLEENLANFEEGPLPDEVAKAFDEGWATAKGVCKPYFQ